MTARGQVSAHGLPPLPLAMLGVALALANAWALVWSIIEIRWAGWAETDWLILSQGAGRVAAGLSPYADSLFRWSPVAAVLLIPLVSLPFWAWLAAHFAAAAALRDLRLTLLVLISWPFWQDASNGNILIFVVLAAVWTIRGSAAGAWAFGALALLVPRPLMLPLIAWQLVRRPEWRLRWGLLFFAHLMLVAMAGYGDEWVSVMLASGNEILSTYNLGPSAMLGLVWLPIGLAIAMWLTLRGRLGLASLAISPYWFPYYLQVLLLEFVPWQDETAPAGRPALRGHSIAIRPVLSAVTQRMPFRP